MAEAIAALHGLQFASDMGFSHVILESDSKLTIKNLTFPGGDYSETRSVTFDVKVWARSFSGCRFEFTARQGNSVTHALAEEGMRRLEDCF
ncbi:hypothetical protein Goshw_026330 [Gossypium schwendimanii]|nr:hypothetical protein [Gossypium schwendimanii]